MAEPMTWLSSSSGRARGETNHNSSRVQAMHNLWPSSGKPENRAHTTRWEWRKANKSSLGTKLRGRVHGQEVELMDEANRPSSGLGGRAPPLSSKAEQQQPECENRPSMRMTSSSPSSFKNELRLAEYRSTTETSLKLSMHQSSTLR
ncbi:hypothetical protein Dimus_024785 [Dionaea muscipula]